MPKGNRGFPKPLCLILVLAVALGAMTACATSTTQQKAETPEWRFHAIVDVDFVRPYAVVPQPKGAMLIDSRPYQKKYALGHIPTAVSIPDSQFEKMTDKLPKDKNTLLIFYCEGPT